MSELNESSRRSVDLPVPEPRFSRLLSKANVEEVSTTDCDKSRVNQLVAHLDAKCSSARARTRIERIDRILLKEVKMGKLRLI
jgi:hypothetical protein